MPEAIDIKIKAQCIHDYKTGDYTMEQLAEKYSINKNTVWKALQGTEKGALKKEIGELIENVEKAKMTESLESVGVNELFIAEKVLMLLNSTDMKDVRAGIQEYAKFTDTYKDKTEDRQAQGADGPNISVYLPKNVRHQG